MKRRTISQLGVLGSMLLSSLGCSGSGTMPVDDSADVTEPPAVGGGGGAPASTNGRAGGSTSQPAQPEPADPVGMPAPAGRFSRLTHAQWENTVRDLLLLPEPSGLSATFPTDPRTAGFVFDNDGQRLQIDQALWQALQRAASELAMQVTSDPAVLERLLPPTTGDDLERATSFVEEFGLRTFRRPLAPAEVARYVSLYEQGTTLYADAPGFPGGIRLVLEALLQSPNFLYRVERSSVARDAWVPLDDWEIAQRLSYLLTNSMPDETSFERAAAASLHTPEQVREQAERLLETAPSRAVISDYYAQWLDIAGYGSIAPSNNAFPDVSEGLPEFAAEETRRFVEDVVFEAGGGLAELLSSSETFVNAELAALYGLSGDFDENYRKVSLDPSQRRGLLTQIGFLAANATSVHPDPIHRGVFIATRLACIAIAAPPNGIPPLPPIEDGTNREVVAAHTETDPGCRVCHGPLINPFGFPFENYDAVGAYRTLDNGFPVDPSTTPTLDGATRPVANALELVAALAASPQVHECYARHLVQYAFGRPYSADDRGLVQELATQSLTPQQGTLELLLRLVQSPAFLNRSTEELP